ncbi:MAG: hypothetical protein MUF46_10150, partial [Desulfobacterales bacterium]|nr:hypothetical protein [Desulfobacterales bacterium]
MLRPFIRRLKALLAPAARRLSAPVYFGRSLASVPAGAVVVAPLRATVLGCGIAGIVAFKRNAPQTVEVPVAPLAALAERLPANGFAACRARAEGLAEGYLGGEACMRELVRQARELRREEAFARIYADPALQARLEALASRLAACQEAEAGCFEEQVGRLAAAEA